MQFPNLIEKRILTVKTSLTRLRVCDHYTCPVLSVDNTLSVHVLAETTQNIVEIPTVQELMIGQEIPEVQVVARIHTKFASQDLWRGVSCEQQFILFFLRISLHVAQLVPLSSLSRLKTFAHPSVR